MIPVKTLNYFLTLAPLSFLFSGFILSLLLFLSPHFVFFCDRILMYSRLPIELTMSMRMILSPNPPAYTLHGIELQAYTTTLGLCGLGIDRMGFMKDSQLYTSTLFTLLILFPFISNFSCVPQLPLKFITIYTFSEQCPSVLYALPYSS